MRLNVPSDLPLNFRVGPVSCARPASVATLDHITKTVLSAADNCFAELTAFEARVTYTYRVFIETEDANTDAMHYGSEKLCEGAIFRVNKPGTLIHGRPVIIYQVDNHPGDETPGIAHARVEVKD